MILKLIYGYKIGRNSFIKSSLGSKFSFLILSTNEQILPHTIKENLKGGQF